MTKKRKMTMTTLTCGWIHTADRPRLSGSPTCFTHVLLSNRVLMASRGINWERRKRRGQFSRDARYFLFLENCFPVSLFKGPFCSFLRDGFYPWAKVPVLRSPRDICAVSSFPYIQVPA